MQEAELLNLLRQPDKKSEYFSVLVDLYKKRVYGIVRKMVVAHEDADDVVQETFVKIWQNVDQFKSESNLFTWIYRIATNESLQFLRKRKNKWSNSDLLETLEDTLHSDSYVDGDEMEVKLQKAILQLPDKQRLVFHLKYYDDLSYEQIAEITETSVGALKASYHHAVKKIEESLQED